MNEEKTDQINHLKEEKKPNQQKKENKNTHEDFSQNAYNLFERMKTFYLKTGDFLRKSAIISYFLKNPNLLKLYDFEPDEFIEDVFSFKTSKSQNFDVNDFIQFLETPRSIKSLDMVNNFMNNNPHRIIADLFYYYLILDKSKLENLKQRFIEKSLEKSQNLTAFQVLSLIEDFHKDFENLDVLNSIVYYIEPINRIVTLSNILLDLRAEIIFEHKNKASISGIDFANTTWEDIEDYILNYNIKTEKSFQGIVSHAVLSIYKNENAVEFEHFDYIHSVFNSIIDTCGFIETSNLLIRLKTDDYLSTKMKLLVRISKNNKYANCRYADETLEELFDRIERESESYLDFNEFQQYFTHRGFPM